MTNIAVFASGSGSNAVNLVKTFNSGNRIHVALCLVDRENIPVIEKMQDLGVETIYFPRKTWREDPQAIVDVLQKHDIKVIALAGFLSIVKPPIVDAYEGKILNIHPSLLPAYGGMGMHGGNVHKAVIEAGETKSGATVHVVTNDVDAGPIVVQREVAVLPEDTPESLEAKVHEVEYQIFPEAVIKTLASLTPPPAPKSVDDAWAETLGIPNNVPPIPQSSPTNPTNPASLTNPTAPINPIGLTSPTGPTGPIGLTAPTGPTTRQLDNSTTIMPPTYLVWSVIMTILCCTIPGIVAIIFSAKVSSKFYQGDIEGACRASRNAEIWIIVSFVLGVLSASLYLPLSLVGLF